MVDDNEAAPDETVVPAEGEGSEEFRPFDEISDEYQPSAMKTVRGEDGLPTYAKESDGSDIPPLSLNTLVCLGDFRQFVTRDDYGNVSEIYKPEQVKQHPDGRWFVTTEGILPVEVEPIRPPCRHYVAQVTQMDLNPQKKAHLRLCSARRTTEGAFMSVRDLAMWACSMREPRHFESEKLIHEFDAKKMREGAKREHFSLRGEGKEQADD